jgi:hypothetical protein
MTPRIDIPIAHPSSIPMNILLTDGQTNFVQAQITSGQCSSPEEVIAIALEMMAHSQETHDPIWLNETSIKVQVGLDDICPWRCPRRRNGDRTTSATASTEARRSRPHDPFLAISLEFNLLKTTLQHRRERNQSAAMAWLMTQIQHQPNSQSTVS